MSMQPCTPCYASLTSGATPKCSYMSLSARETKYEAQALQRLSSNHLLELCTQGRIFLWKAQFFSGHCLSFPAFALSTKTEWCGQKWIESV